MVMIQAVFNNAEQKVMPSPILKEPPLPWENTYSPVKVIRIDSSRFFDGTFLFSNEMQTGTNTIDIWDMNTELDADV